MCDTCERNVFLCACSEIVMIDRMDNPTPLRAIVFFDGTCGLCDRFIAFVLTHGPRDGSIFVAPLHGSTAHQMLGTDLAAQLHTVIYWRAGTTHMRSRAVGWVLRDMGGGSRALGMMLHAIPRVFADWIYDGVARHRYSVFGRRDVCQVPSGEERKRFLP